MGTAFNLEKFRANSSVQSTSAIPAHIVAMAGGMVDNSDLDSPVGEFPLADPKEIVNRCANIRDAVINQNGVSEPYWREMLGIAAYCHDPEKTAIEWSREHPSYDEDKTLRKLDARRNGGKATLCETLEQHNPGACGGCAQKGKIKSPIILGYPKSEEPKVDVVTRLFDIAQCQPVYIPDGMAAREFAGPRIAPHVSMFPKGAICGLVSLGAGGKTTTALAMLAHCAAGKSWDGYPVTKSAAIMFCVEEVREELHRKYSALVAGWSEAERAECTKNLLLVSCVGMDARLTVIDYGAHRETSAPQEVIELAKEHEARCGVAIGTICFDHLQGFTSGDLNGSETAVTLARAGNRIASGTGAAVVFTAHIAKANIGATELSAGFTTGSLAFENAMRQVVGLIPMSEDKAKQYGVEDFRKDYIWAGLIKNSYADPDSGCWLKKRVSTDYHTVVVEPACLVEPTKTKAKPANEALIDRIREYVAARQWVTRNQIDLAAGEDGPLKAGQTKVRAALSVMLEQGALVTHDVTETERQRHQLDKRVRQVLRVFGRQSSR